MRYLLQSLWRGLRANLGLLRLPPFFYRYDPQFSRAVKDLAVRERRSEEDLTTELFTLALGRKQENEIWLQCWHSLSSREQQVAALTCLNHTNKQIATRLNISPATVAAHLRKILYKFNLHSKIELRHALCHWDFNTWDRQH